MLKFKKVFNLEIIALLFLAVFFCLDSVVYGIDSSLRSNILSNTEEGRGRLKDGFGYMSDFKGWPNNIYERAGKSFREVHDTYSRSWSPHIKNNKKNILRACMGLKGGTAILLGAGESLSVPLREITSKFDKVILVDIDRQSVEKSLQAIPKNLQNKIIIEERDITGVYSHIMAEASSIFEKYNNDEEKAFEALCSLLTSIQTGDNDILPGFEKSCDFVVSSLVVSTLAYYLLLQIDEEFKKVFGDTSEERFDSFEWFKAKNSLASNLEKAHIGLLRKLVKDNGKVFISDTVTRYTIKGLNAFGKFFVSGKGQKINVHNLSDSFKGNFNIDRKDTWGWVIRPVYFRLDVGTMSEVESYILTPHNGRTALPEKTAPDFLILLRNIWPKNVLRWL